MNNCRWKIVVLAFAISACSSPMKPIKVSHKESMTRVFARYKKVLMKHDWEIRRSDGAGGFLSAIKPEKVLFSITSIFRTIISCADAGGVSCHVKITKCSNTVPLSGCAVICEKTAENDEMKRFINDIRRIK